MARRRRTPTRIGSRSTLPSADSLTPSERLERLAKDAVEVCKTARRHRKSLSGDNYYANKLATLRADATNSLRQLASSSVGDSTAVAELMEAIFSPSTEKKARLSAFQEFAYNLKTTWRSAAVPREDEGLFPLSVLAQANRSYLVTVGRQMNGCFTSGWYDAASVMMRRLVEIAIIEAFEGKGIPDRIKDSNGNYFQLTDLVAKAVSEKAFSLSRNAKTALPALRDVGHRSAHGRYFTAKKEDLSSLKSECRVVIEEMLHHAGLL
jgi:hypothetical protein